MNASEAIELVKESELKQLSVKNDKKVILGFLNMGILEIHKRFVLWQAEATITMATGVTSYKLDGTDPNVTIDLSDHELLMVDEAFDYDGEPLSINDENDELSLATPQYNVIEMRPDSVTDAVTISLIYRGAPKFLTHEKAIIPLPPQFYEALFHYVGFRGHGSQKTGEAQLADNTHYKRFDNSCKRIKFEGLYTEDSMESTKFDDRGFV